ncbi:hypothetical protein [Sagittula sp. S175]|uniref:hypothetical protein n=1 Tax=Sagittula sp. S175 TaxID=3415129 RepID=UPI003C7D85CB
MTKTTEYKCPCVCTGNARIDCTATDLNSCIIRQMLMNGDFSPRARRQPEQVSELMEVPA